MDKKLFILILLIGFFILYFFIDIKTIKENINISKQDNVCAKEGEQVNRNPLIGPTDKKCCSGLLEERVSKSYSICRQPKKDEGILIFSPRENEKIKSPLKIEGKAKGFWFFEAQFNVELYDLNNNLLGFSTLTAKGDWTKEDYIDFEGELKFIENTTDFGILRFRGANASGLPENEKIFELIVEFEKPIYQKVLLYYYNPEKDKDETGNIKCSKDGLVAIEREIPFTKTPIQDTISLLLKGKNNFNENDIREGIETEYPLEGFKLKSANLKKDGTLVLEFEDPLNKSSGGACRTALLWFQIEMTAKQFIGVKKVEFLPDYLFQP